MGFFHYFIIGIGLLVATSIYVLDSRPSFAPTGDLPEMTCGEVKSDNYVIKKGAKATGFGEEETGLGIVESENIARRKCMSQLALDAASANNGQKPDDPGFWFSCREAQNQCYAEGGTGCLAFFDSNIESSRSKVRFNCASSQVPIYVSTGKQALFWQTTCSCEIVLDISVTDSWGCGECLKEEKKDSSEI